MWRHRRVPTIHNSCSSKVNVTKVNFLVSCSNRGRICRGCSSRCTPNSYHRVPRWAHTRAYLRFLDLVPARDFLFLRQPPRRFSVWVFHLQRPLVAQPLTLSRCWRNRTCIGVSPTTWSITEVSLSPNVSPHRFHVFLCMHVPRHLGEIYATPSKHIDRRQCRG